MNFLKTTTLSFLTVISCGTAYAAKDVLGFELGMSPEKARPLIENRGAELKISPQVGTVQLSIRNAATDRTEPLADSTYTSYIRIGEARQEINGSDNQDEINLNFTSSPGSEKLAAIYRRVGFSGSNAPLLINLVSDLKKKYGAPTFEYADESKMPVLLLWSFGEKGSLMPKNGGLTCNVNFPAPTANNSHPTAPRVSWVQPIQSAGYEGLDSYYSDCGSTILMIRFTRNSQLGTVNRLYFQYLGVRDVITAQESANQLMAKASEASKNRAIKGANQVQSPKL